MQIRVDVVPVFLRAPGTGAKQNPARGNFKHDRRWSYRYRGNQLQQVRDDRDANREFGRVVS